MITNKTKNLLLRTAIANPQEKLIGTADALVRLGLHEHGYTIVGIDDFWAERQRDEDGRLKVNETRYKIPVHLGPVNTT